MPSPFRFGVLGISPLTPRDLAQSAQRVEALGYSLYLVPDHLGMVAASPLPLLAYIAARTTTIRLGTQVLNNDFRNPAVLAKELATIDDLSDGRLIAGLGAGWLPADYEESGIPMERPGRRIARLEDALAVIDRLLRGDGDVVNRPACVQKPRPPILVGGASPRILGLAGRRADIVGITWNVRAGMASDEAMASRTPEATDEKVRLVRDAAGPRAGQLEWHMHAAFVDVTDRPDDAARGLLGGAGDTRTFLDSPHCLIGETSQIVDKLLAARERWGFSYITVPDMAADAMAPVVARLAGQQADGRTTASAPPSTTSTWRSMYDARDDRRKAMRSATSSGCPQRTRGSLAI